MNVASAHDDVPDAFSDALEGFIEVIVSAVVRDAPPAELYRLAEAVIPDLLPSLPQQPDSAEGVRAMAHMLARSIADHTPRPDRRFAQHRLPRPGRNDPCDCGSGGKYKHCCLALEHGAPDDPIARTNLLPYVLDCLPRKRWRELVGSAIDPLAVDSAAREMLDDGDGEYAVALLEPWFEQGAEIPGKQDPLLDALLDAYTVLGRPRKKKRLIAQALAQGDRAIRSSVHQRQATMAADAGDFDAAWRHFRQAQREDADSTSLSHLEVLLLMSQGEHAQARERARFWIARLQRADAAGHTDLIDLLRNMADHGEQALFGIHTQQWPELETLQALLHAAPAPAMRHTFVGGGGDDLGVLRPDRTLAAALEAWAQAFPQAGPPLTSLVIDGHPAWDHPEPWLQCLRKNPPLWQSFDVLDDLVLALAGIFMPGMAPLRDALLDRGEALLHQALDGHPGRTLEWGHTENRPALRLLAQRIACGDARTDAATLKRMEWMLALNPNDNHGYRDELAAVWLCRGEPARVLAIGERYPADSSLAFARVLALYALGREGEALRILQEAHATLPRIAPMLAAASPRKPALKPGWITFGGADQAWYHREQYRPAWERCEGALPWLSQALRAMKRRGG